MAAAPMSPGFSRPQPTKAKILIVGAGLGGLVLAALLEKAGIEYEVFERAKKVIPLGSAISLGASIMPLFCQLGIEEVVKSKSKIILDCLQHNDRALVPAHKIHMATKVLTIDQDTAGGGGVTIYCSDQKSYKGDILVGADGAYSMVRQHLYEWLSSENRLPESDKELLPFTNICLVGTTNSMDPEEFPFLKREETHFMSIIGEAVPYSWVYFTVPDNRVCWMVVEHLEDKVYKPSSSSSPSSSTPAPDSQNKINVEWVPGAAQQMCDQTRHFRFPDGTTIGDFIDRTDRDLISRVMLEEKMFETWYGGRIVLMGDACHKLHPSAGLGAVNAMHDAIILASRLYGLMGQPENGSADGTLHYTVEGIEEVLKAYQDERKPLATISYEASQQMAQLLGRNWISRMVRKILNTLPEWFMYGFFDRLMAYRPQVTFLPLPKQPGSIPPAPQTSLALANAFDPQYEPKWTVSYK
ncbi:hypothetical protein BGW38_010936 [Lunasporangiospora selenospora]|uniref:FAD-binding domain-containing protein n=1 Tax=Lunasporangiospora selenospora TaxID=979761 RepID=A0A9P6FW84_9FUNG|nr:hypothetical protein BGW38_010936 [Lunasporangiospora selenospora]